MKKELIISNNEKIKLPYVLITPDDYDRDSHLFVELSSVKPNDGTVLDQMNELIEENTGNSMNYTLHALFEELKYPIIIPIIPRAKNFNAPYLSSFVLNNDFTRCDVTEEEKELLRDVPLQVKLMIEEAIDRLGLTKKAILKGYSSTAKFASQFSVLYPEVVDMTICGGTAGLSTLPIASYNGMELPYPIGVADVPNFNKEEWMKIRHFLYIGDEDNNNPALPKCEMGEDFDPNGNRLPKLDSEGNLTFIRDSDGLLLPTYDDLYTKEQINIIHNFYGDNNQERFKKNEEIYHELGVDSVHKMYPGNHITLFRNNRETIISDIVGFIKEAYKKTRGI